MIILLSPAKIQQFKPESPLCSFTQPKYLNEAEELVQQIRCLSVSSLANLLNINPSMALQNAERFSRWQLPFSDKNAKPAVQVFNGEVFHGLDVRNLHSSHYEYLQNHLRIFSGLYGLLRPFDLIQPYRLDFGDPFRTQNNQNLYAYWTEKLTQNLNEMLVETNEPSIVLNLASGEYIKGINQKKLSARVISVDFLQNEPSGSKTIVIYTKKARGMMTRFVVENRIEDPENLKGFDSEGYLFDPDMSKENRFVFTR
jgi:uncharacterized protein